MEAASCKADILGGLHHGPYPKPFAEFVQPTGRAGASGGVFSLT